MLREYQKKYHVTFSDEDIQRRVAGTHFPDLETFLRDIGSGKKVLDKSMLQSLFPELSAVKIQTPKRPPRRAPAEPQLIRVEGQDGIAYTLARCCSPIKGDEIIGYLTKNRGLVIHKKNCPNINADIPSRLKQVSWSETEHRLWLVRLELIAADRPGMLNPITGIPAACDSNIKKIEQEQVSQALVKITHHLRSAGRVSDEKNLRGVEKKPGHLFDQPQENYLSRVVIHDGGQTGP